VKKADRGPDHRLREEETTGPGRPTRRSLFRGAAGGMAAFGGAALETGLGAKAALAQDGPELRGAWQAQLLRDNAPPGFGPTRFLFTFTAGGDVIAVGPPILVENGVRAFIPAQLGEWSQTSTGTFRFTFNTASYGEDGTLNYTINSQMELTLAVNRRSWTGTYVRQDVALDGSVIRSVTGTAAAQPLWS
jgi:hypothetical protein